MHGCFGASPPQIPHLGIFSHPLSLATLILARSITCRGKAICSRCYIVEFDFVFSVKKSAGMVSSLVVTASPLMILARLERKHRALEGNVQKVLQKRMI